MLWFDYIWYVFAKLQKKTQLYQYGKEHLNEVNQMLLYSTVKYQWMHNLISLHILPPLNETLALLSLHWSVSYK